MSLRSRCLGIAIAACLMALPAASWANPRTTAEVLQNHLEAFCPGGVDDPADVDRIMEDYHVNALSITGNNLGAPPAISAGRPSIRAGFEGLFAAVTNGCGLVLTQQVVNGQYGFVQWVWPELGGLAPGFDAWGTDTFLVKGGQIQLQTVFIFFAPQP
jgi:hypothetical protein